MPQPAPHIPPPRDIESNNLARDLAATSASPPPQLPLIYHFPSSGASLVSETNTLTGSLSYSIRTIKNTKALRQHTEQRHKWPPQIWDTIDWDAHHFSLRRLTKSKNRTAKKFIHGWLPTLHKLHRYKQHPHSICPCCNTDRETNNHLLQCSWRTDAAFRMTQTALLTNILNPTSSPDTTLQDTVLLSIHHWMYDLPQPDFDHLLDTDSDQFIHALAATQHIIGWDNFFRARLTNAWHLCQPPLTNISSTIWIKQLTTWIWNLFFECWTSRNSILFGDSPASKNKINILRLEAKVREQYAACDQLPPTHRNHTQYTSLDQLLKCHPETLTMWLTQTTMTLQEHRKAINKGTSQRLITWYFVPGP